MSSNISVFPFSKAFRPLSGKRIMQPTLYRSVQIRIFPQEITVFWLPVDGGDGCHGVVVLELLSVAQRFGVDSDQRADVSRRICGELSMRGMLAADEIDYVFTACYGVIKREFGLPPDSKREYGLFTEQQNGRVCSSPCGLYRSRSPGHRGNLDEEGTETRKTLKQTYLWGDRKWTSSKTDILEKMNDAVFPLQ